MHTQIEFATQQLKAQIEQFYSDIIGELPVNAVSLDFRTKRNGDYIEIYNGKCLVGKATIVLDVEVMQATLIRVEVK